MASVKVTAAKDGGLLELIAVYGPTKRKADTSGSSVTVKDSVSPGEVVDVIVTGQIGSGVKITSVPPATNVANGTYTMNASIFRKRLRY
mgnify:CR=1 FL=1